MCMGNPTTRTIEITYLREKLEESDIQKFAEILAAGVCDYLRARGKGGVSKAAAKRAASALKTARDIGVKCSENPTENALISGEEGSTL